MTQGRVLLRNECASETYTTDVLASILREEGKGLFDARTAVLGHVQQGGAPSPLDRIRACRMAASCITFIESNVKFNKSLEGAVYNVEKESICVCGIKGTDIHFTPIVDLIKEANMETRKPVHGWWMKYCSLVPLLSKYPLKLQTQEKMNENENIKKQTSSIVEKRNAVHCF
ncbi:6-phosphofructokinase, alpha subunit [Coelomomyces lativittatus]|nr:6-phosphofructokinase, alpha subunit [Coelomomyces lativittatus]